MDEYKPINVHGILLTAVHDGGTGEDSTFRMNHFYCLPNTATPLHCSIGMIFGTHLALDNSDHVLDGGPNPPTEGGFTKRTTSCVMHNGVFTKRTTSRSGRPPQH